MEGKAHFPLGSNGLLQNDPKIVNLAASDDPGPRPKRLSLSDGRIVVSYSRTRFHLDRDAWEMLPEDGIFLPRIRTTNRQSLMAFAFTKRELEEAFGHIRATVSWKDKRCYHYPKVPVAALPFCIARCGKRGIAATHHPIGSRAEAARVVELIESLPANIPRVEWAREVAKLCGLEPESQAYLERVHQGREAWRPRSIRILIVWDTVSRNSAWEHPGRSAERTASGNCSVSSPRRSAIVRLARKLAKGCPGS